MIAIINTFNKIQYVLIYSRHKRFLNPDVTPITEEFITEQQPLPINTQNIPYYEESISNPNDTQFFFDGAPGHILTTKDTHLAKKFLNINHAYAILKEKFNNTFHEGKCQEDTIITTTNQQEPNYIDFIFSKPNSQTQIINRFTLYNTTSYDKTKSTTRKTKTKS